jgi:hypothetical protein
MAARNLSARSGHAALDPLRIDSARLKRAKRILGTDSDVDTVNKALALIITNEEMETAIEKAFGTIPYFEAR